MAAQGRPGGAFGSLRMGGKSIRRQPPLTLDIDAIADKLRRSYS